MCNGFICKKFKYVKMSKVQLPCCLSDVSNVSKNCLAPTKNENLTWNEHINNIVKKANKRLFFLRTLKKSGVSTEDLNTYYKSVIRPVRNIAARYGIPQ